MYRTLIFIDELIRKKKLEMANTFISPQNIRQKYVKTPK
jgi:hypothetical protein